MESDKPAEFRSRAEGGEKQFYQVEDGWMETFTGKKFHFMHPTHEEIDIVDIAHALGKLCRYGGHTQRFYSVAEHSVRLAMHLNGRYGDCRLTYEGLLHDATEGYLVDMPRPIKHVLSQYKDIERGLERTIAAKFGLRQPMDPRIHEADARILVDERAQVMSRSGNDWGVDALKPLGDVHIAFWTPLEAPRLFLAYYDTVLRTLGNRELVD